MNKDFFKKVNWEIVGLIFILLFAFFIRVIDLGDSPLVEIY
jgi:hypothetical protein